MRNLLALVLILAVAAGIGACTPKSAMSTKVVIIDSTLYSIDGRLEYKVEYLSYGVVDYIYTPFLYEVGDTLLVNDKYRGRDIQ